MDRRKFLSITLKTGILTATGFGLPLSLAAPSSNKTRNQTRNLALACLSREKDPLFSASGWRAGNVNGTMTLYDLDTQEFKSFEIGCFGHSFIQNPAQPSQVISVSKWGQYGAIFDIREAKMIRRLKAPMGLRFFGHTVFDSNGYAFISSASNDDNQGFILVYDSKNWELIKKIKTNAIAPHDLFFLRKDQLAVAHSFKTLTPEYGSGGAVTLVDVKKDDVIKEFLVPHPNHMQPIGDKAIVIGNTNTAKGEGDFYMVDADSGHIVMNSVNASGFEPQNLKGEKLSLGLLREDVVVSTTAAGKQLLIWDLKNQKLSSKTLPDSVKGLYRHGASLLVSTDDGHLYSFPIENDGTSLGAPKELIKNFGNSSHLRVLSV